MTTPPGTQQRHADTYLLRHLGLNGMDYLLLSTCAKYPCARPDELGPRIGRSAKHVSNVANYLVLDGLLERQGRGLVVTARGKRALAQARKALRTASPAVQAPLMLGTPPTHALRQTSPAARAARPAPPRTPLSPDAPLWVLALPFDMHNRLRRAGIHTVADLVAVPADKLRSLPGIGVRSVPVIAGALAAAGLRPSHAGAAEPPAPTAERAAADGP